jgi:hypothetical protein
MCKWDKKTPARTLFRQTDHSREEPVTLDFEAKIRQFPQMEEHTPSKCCMFAAKSAPTLRQ